MKKKVKFLDPIPPGEILLEDFMKPLKISMNQLARDIDVPPGHISEIVHAKRSITADTALRLDTTSGARSIVLSLSGLRLLFVYTGRV